MSHSSETHSTEPQSPDEIVSELEQLVSNEIDAESFSGNDDDLFALAKKAYELGKTHQYQAAQATPTVPKSGEGFLVRWEIDDLDQSSTPEAAAARVWCSPEYFRRSMAGDDDSCVFTVLDRATGEITTVDLSDYDIKEVLEIG